MQKVNVLIVEDDMITATDLSLHLTRMGYEVVGIMTKAEDALEYIKNTPPEIILMDIQLKGKMNGIQAAEMINRMDAQIIIIFLTANFDDDTYNKAKLTRPHAFISKPFKAKDLSRAIELAVLNRQVEEQSEATQGEKDLEELRNQNNYILSDRIFIKSKNKLIKIYIKDIQYAEADRNYCLIHFDSGTHLLTMPLGALEQKINNKKLIRVHRSYLVNIDQIDELLDNYNYLAIEGTVIPVSKGYREGLMNRINVL